MHSFILEMRIESLTIQRGNKYTFKISNYPFKSNLSFVHTYLYRWRKHALAIKEVDPTIKTIFNLNTLSSSTLKSIVNSIGIDVIDGAEFHGKWPAGGKKAEPVSLEDWMKEVPLIDHKPGINRNYRVRTKEMRETLQEMGVTKKFFLANNEWGLNTNKAIYPTGFDRLMNL